MSNTETNNLALILMYHHIADVRSNAGVLSVSPQHFSEQLEVLQKEARPLRLEQITTNLSRSRVAPRSVVITFDDGYADNLIHAKPLLEHHDLPATVFVTADANDRSEFWWDELERLLLLPGVLPENLELVIGGKYFMWNLGDAAAYKEDSWLRFRSWRVWEDPPTLRHSLYGSLCRLLRPLSCEVQQTAMRDLKHWAGAKEGGFEAHRRLTPGEIVSLAQGHLIEVGGHTATHPLLSHLTSDHQRYEIKKNKFFLENILGIPVTSFAYPDGDYTRETLEIVCEAGFRLACSTIISAVQPDTDLFQLPRLHVWDFDGDEFERWLRQMWAIATPPVFRRIAIGKDPGYFSRGEPVSEIESSNSTKGWGDDSLKRAQDAQNANEEPLVSIIMIFLNEECFIQEAVESIFRQNYSSWEVLLVDDGSSDRSTEIALQYSGRWPGKVRYLQHFQHANLGMSASRNLGLTYARGEYLAFLDADDVWLPNKLEVQVADLNGRKELGMIYGATEYWFSWTGNPDDLRRDYIWEPGVGIPRVFVPPDLLTSFLLGKTRMPCMGSVLVRCEAVERVGGWEDSFRGLYEDQVFFAKLCLAVPILVTDECMDRYRQHPRSACATAAKKGHVEGARRTFLEWLARFMLNAGLQGTEPWRVLERQFGTTIRISG